MRVNEMKPMSARVGFTLLEMLMVLVIMSSIVVMIANYTMVKSDQIRRDSAAIQIQQIENGALAYYLNNGSWPSGTTLSTLQSAGYLPTTMHSPYISKSYTIGSNSTTGVFTASLTVEKASDALILAGMVPLGSVGGTGNLTVSSQVNIPGQNLNNARSVNFAGYYHNGGCVPAPVCPGNMAPDVLVVPAALYGVNDMGASSAYYPLYGFQAYAYGQSGNPPGTAPVAAASVADCANPGSARACQTSGGSPMPTSSTLYWRVCLSVTTTKGVVSSTADATWGQYTTIMAITRCVPQAENAGSDFTVWTQ